MFLSHAELLLFGMTKIYEIGLVMIKICVSSLLLLHNIWSNTFARSEVSLILKGNSDLLHFEGVLWVICWECLFADYISIQVWITKNRRLHLKPKFPLSTNKNKSKWCFNKIMKHSIVWPLVIRVGKVAIRTREISALHFISKHMNPPWWRSTPLFGIYTSKCWGRNFMNQYYW